MTERKTKKTSLGFNEVFLDKSRAKSISAVFADFVADESASCGTTHSPQRATQDGVACHAAQYCACCGADLRIGRVGTATGERDQGGSGHAHQNFRHHTSHLFFGRDQAWLSAVVLSRSAGFACDLTVIALLMRDCRKKPPPSVV